MGNMNDIVNMSIEDLQEAIDGINEDTFDMSLVDMTIRHINAEIESAIRQFKFVNCKNHSVPINTVLKTLKKIQIARLLEDGRVEEAMKLTLEL